METALRPYIPELGHVDIWLFAGVSRNTAYRSPFDERLELPGLSLLDAGPTTRSAPALANRLRVYREPMDLSRFSSSSYRTLLRSFSSMLNMRTKKIDVAIAVMAPAFEFLLANGELIFPGTPIVFCGLDKRQLGTGPLPSNVYGVLIKRRLRPTLELALRLHPATENVVVVSGSSEFDASLFLRRARKVSSIREAGVVFTYLSELSLQQVLERVSQLPARSLVLFTTMFRSGIGPSTRSTMSSNAFRASQVCRSMAFLDQYLGRGIVEACIVPARSLPRPPKWHCRY